MARLKHTRRITADCGDKVEFDLYFDRGHVVADDRNGISIECADGSEWFVPVSVGALRRTGRWIEEKTRDADD